MTPEAAGQTRKIIGILGGMGPQAGFDVASKITSMTPASTDQDHFSLIVLSMPSEIEDRTAFLTGQSESNPAEQLQKQIEILFRLNADVVAMACNTAHADPILGPLLDFTKRECHPMGFLNLINETVSFVRQSLPDAARIGILGTRATYKFQLYDHAIQAAGLDVVLPDQDIRESCIFPAIYDPVVGIKARSNPVSEESRELVEQAVVHLARNGADAVILGCTELPLALAGSAGNGHNRILKVDGRPVELIDPAVAMARALLTYCGG